MSIYLLYALTIILTIILFTIIKDIIRTLKLTGIITIISSFTIVSLTLIIKLILNNTVTSINISVITDHIFQKSAKTSIILLVIGLTEILISKHLYHKKTTRKATSSN